MSGIYGLYRITDTDKIDRLSLWNSAYGDVSGISVIPEKVAMGCFLEKLNTNLQSSSAAIEIDDYLAVIDAVIYNRNEILDKLSKKLSDDISDEELLLSYILNSGYDALQNVNGDFAGAIYDKTQNSIILFRDHMGVRPLFYYAKDGFVAFSTDIRGIIAIPEVDATISDEWVYRVLGGYFINGTTTTEFQNVFCVNPGSYLKFDSSDEEIKKETHAYWTVGKNKIKLKSDEEYQKKLRELVEDSVKIRLDAVSGKVGAELSGGLDSGVIDILINRQGRECIYYSWSRSPEELEMAENDERLIIKDICEQEGISCHYGSYVLDENTVFADKYKKTGAMLDFKEMVGFRYAFPPYINTPKIAQTATDVGRLGATVVFSGHGGDEGVSHRCNQYEMFHYREFYHYFRYVFSRSHGQKHRIWITLRECFYSLTEDRKEFKSPFVGSINAPQLMNKELAGKFDPKKMPLLYFAFDPISYIRTGGSRSRLDNASILGAYSGARYIFPYVDYRAIDFAVSIPRYQYLRGRKDRYIFREAFKDIIPDSLYRWKAKETMSQRNIKSDPNWFKQFDADKKMIISRLDREYWEKYLDFDAVEAFKNAGEPEGEEKAKQDNMFYCLYMLALAQNLIDKVRA